MRNPTGFCLGGWDLPGGRKSHKIWFSSSFLEENQAGQEKVVCTFLLGTSEREQGSLPGLGRSNETPRSSSSCTVPQPCPASLALVGCLHLHQDCVVPLLATATADAGNQRTDQGNDADDNGSDGQPTLGLGHAPCAAVFGDLDGGQIGVVLHGAGEVSGGDGGGIRVAGCVWVLWCLRVAGHLRDHWDLDTGDNRIDVDDDEGLTSDAGWAETHRESIRPQPGLVEQEPIVERKDV